MPKDVKKYRYVDAPLLRGSATLAALEQDAAAHHMSDTIGKMAALRLTDYYTLAARLGTSSLEGLLAALATHASQQEGAESTPLLKEPHQAVFLEPSQSREANAELASDFWNTL